MRLVVTSHFDIGHALALPFEPEQRRLKKTFLLNNLKTNNEI